MLFFLFGDRKYPRLCGQGRNLQNGSSYVYKIDKVFNSKKKKNEQDDLHPPQEQRYTKNSLLQTFCRQTSQNSIIPFEKSIIAFSSKSNIPENRCYPWKLCQSVNEASTSWHLGCSGEASGCSFSCFCSVYNADIVSIWCLHTWQGTKQLWLLQTMG